MSTVGLDLNDHSVIDLTTVGRVTGRPHRIEIWFAQHNTTVYMLSGGRDRSDWVRNIIANPAATVHANGTDYQGDARIVVEKDEQRLARDAVFDKYTATEGGDLTSWRESSLPIAVDLNVSTPSTEEP